MEAWRKTKLQKGVVYKMRNVLNDIRPKDKAAVADDLRRVFDNFDAYDENRGLQKVDSFVLKWEVKYPTIKRHFNKNTLEYHFTYIF